MTTTTTAIPETTRTTTIQTTTMNTNTSTAIPGNFLKNLNETKTVFYYEFSILIIKFLNLYRN